MLTARLLPDKEVGSLPDAEAPPGGGGNTTPPIDPLAAPEAKVFVEDKEIMAMRDLRLALDANDLVRFERTLRDKGNKIIDEPFLMKYIDPLHRRMHEQVLVNVLKPYVVQRILRRLRP